MQCRREEVTRHSAWHPARDGSVLTPHLRRLAAGGAFDFRTLLATHAVYRDAAIPVSLAEAQRLIERMVA